MGTAFRAAGGSSEGGGSTVPWCRGGTLGSDGEAGVKGFEGEDVSDGGEEPHGNCRQAGR